jgi:hypothetical protein
MLPINEWQALLAVNAGASATFTGLVFVAVSINLTRIISIPGLPGRAVESISQFLQVFFLCTAALIPRQSTTALAVEVLSIGIASWALQIATHIKYARSRSGHPLTWLLARIVQTHLASIPFFVAGIYLSVGSSAGLYWLVPGFVFSFLAGVANAWILLVEILR